MALKNASLPTSCNSDPIDATNSLMRCGDGAFSCPPLDWTSVPATFSLKLISLSGVNMAQVGRPVSLSVPDLHMPVVSVVLFCHSATAHSFERPRFSISSKKTFLVT